MRLPVSVLLLLFAATAADATVEASMRLPVPGAQPRPEPFHDGPYGFGVGRSVAVPRALSGGPVDVKGVLDMPLVPVTSGR